MRFVVAVGVCVFLLAGCASGNDGTAGAQQQAARDDALCRSYGTFPGTTPYVQCRLGLKRQAEQRDSSPLDGLFGN